ncbi:glycosyltransferase [Pedobacter sp. LMG 31464]|uniref:Glycosyltransferase n=1 Tax=Pedobacter planticolens TaxID=2679964 RepID=A0A923IW06_9SPHI|nr:glycosyltransferase [Pedobacter planticolens]MBB2144642.1 glycosyltransferase [Pedobacter planticolens]
MNKPKALVVITPGFPKNEDDTTCLPPIQIALKAFQQADPSLTIIVLSLRYPFSSETYQWNGITVISFGGGNKSKLFRAYTFIQTWVRFKKLHQEFNIVGLLSLWLDRSAFIANLLAKRYRIQHFCWLQGQDAKKGNKFVKLIKPKGLSLIAISDFIADEFYSNYQIMPKHIIPIGINTNRFTNELNERDIDILGVGSLIPLKQYDLFLAVIKQLVVDFPTIRACICGAGPEMNKLEKLIKEWNLSANVSLSDELPHSEVLQLMAKSKILLHTSNYEGFGMVNLEALYAGAKVISFVKPMHQEIENWFHVNSSDEMVTMIKATLSNPDYTYKRIMPFSVSTTATAILQLYAYKANAIS